jgi:phage terminase small subunit
MNDKLTPKQEKFWIEYLATGNASEAYRRAYGTTRMTERTMQKRANELLAHGAIKQRPRTRASTRSSST